MVTTVARSGVSAHATHSVLDFANSESARRRATLDPVASADGLAAWLDPAADSSATFAVPPTLPDRRTLVSEARLLRSEIRHLFHAVAGAQPIPAETLFTINRAMDFGRRTSRLVVVAGSPRLETVDAAESPLAILAPIALAAGELVVHADPARLRRCAAEDCSNWFLDTSKGGQRRWCSMARCGNRSKAARYRQRHRSGE
jgi:predicted RNA-binding Zn ribbon-like protein